MCGLFFFRQTALELEKMRAAKIASLPPPPPDPLVNVTAHKGKALQMPSLM